MKMIFVLVKGENRGENIKKMKYNDVLFCVNYLRKIMNMGPNSWLLRVGPTL